MGQKVVIIESQPNINPMFPSPDFNKDDFNDSIWNKGLKVLHEKTVKCPCKTKGVDAHLSSCANCQGTGWVVIDGVQTKMLMTSINASTKYRAWSEENIGTVSISADVRDKFAFMDKVTLLDSRAIISELLYPIVFNGVIFSYTIYNILAIKELFLFVSDTLPLKRLFQGVDYSLDRNKIILDSQYIGLVDPQMSVRYEYNLVFGIIDIPHDIRNSYVIDENGRNTSIELPVQAIGRRFHYLIDGLNYAGDNLIDNSANAL